MLNIKLRTIIKFLVISTSLIILVIQVGDIVHYHNNASHVTIEIGKLDRDSPPAITICRLAVFFFDRMINVSKESRNFYMDKMQNEENPIITYLSMVKYFYKALNENKVNFTRLTNYYLMEYWRYQMSIKAKLEPNYQDHFHDRNFYDWQDLMKSPLYSIVWYNDALIICHTFFSHLDVKWRNFRPFIELSKMNVETVGIDKSGIYESIHQHVNLYISLHSANIMPEFRPGQTFRELDTDTDTNYALKYTKLKVEYYQGNPVHSCQQYDMRSTIKTQSECFITCLQQLLNCKDTIGPEPILMSKQMFESKEQPRSLEFCKQVSNITIRDECTNMCKPNCKITHYIYDINQVDDRYNNFITIGHNYMPDIMIKYSPSEKSLLICNLFALLSFWLGMIMFILARGFGIIKKMLVVKSKVGKVDHANYTLRDHRLSVNHQ